MCSCFYLFDRNYVDAPEAHTFITKVIHSALYCSDYLSYLKNYNATLLMDFIAPVNPPALVTSWDPQLRTAGVLHRIAA